MKQLIAAVVSLAVLAGPMTARAAEVFGGVYAHGLQPKQPEGGVDGLLGVRTGRLESLGFLFKPSVHALVAANTEVDTAFVAVGLNWPIPIGMGGRLYLRPGLGLALTNGETDIGNAFDPGLTAAERARRLRLSSTRIDFGSALLFEPEIGLGYRFSDRISAEVSYLHLSNGEIFHQGKNQGLDDLGVRVNYRFGAR